MAIFRLLIILKTIFHGNLWQDGIFFNVGKFFIFDDVPLCQYKRGSRHALTPKQVKLSQVKSSQVSRHLLTPKQVKSSQVKLCKVKAGQVKLSQVK